MRAYSMRAGGSRFNNIMVDMCDKPKDYSFINIVLQFRRLVKSCRQLNNTMRKCAALCCYILLASECAQKSARPAQAHKSTRAYIKTVPSACVFAFADDVYEYLPAKHCIVLCNQVHPYIHVRGHYKCIRQIYIDIKKTTHK